MDIKIISYSLSGNNEALAQGLSQKLNAERVKIQEPGRRTWLTILLDKSLKRIPKVNPEPDVMKNSDLVVLVGPVWFGKVATPLEPYLEYIKENPIKYAFVSISGGAEGPNAGIAAELREKAGKAPEALVDLYIAHLLPREPKPQVKDTIKYHITPAEAEQLTEKAFEKLRGII